MSFDKSEALLIILPTLLSHCTEKSIRSLSLVNPTFHQFIIHPIEEMNVENLESSNFDNVINGILKQVQFRKWDRNNYFGYLAIQEYEIVYLDDENYRE